VSETQQLRNYVGGEWLDGAGDRFESVNPATGEAVASAPVSTDDEVGAAVAAARAAADDGSWANRRAADRAEALRALADALAARERDAGELIAREMGKPIRVARGREVGGAIDRLRFFSGAARSLDGRVVGAPDRALWDMEIPEPVGVAALIIPWNDPVDLLIRKLGAALAAGCAVVVKPSEVTPASTAFVVELADELGVFPPGVVNLVNGPGVPTGEALVRDARVDKVAFTGSTQTGIRIAQLAAERLARASLECGGKAPAVVFGDADLDRCLDSLTFGAFMYSGQSCTACTRLLVEDTAYDEVLDGIVERARELPHGDPMDDRMLIGPMATRGQYEKAVRYLAIAQEDGGKAVLGGDEGDPGDLYLRPTIVTDVPLDSRVTQEEVFGPLLTVTRFDGEDEALAIANATSFGLGASVWTGDGARALRLARGLDFADVWVNGYYLRHAETTFGGRHMSGIGRELGIRGVEEYVSWKRVCIDTRTDDFHLKTWFERGEDFRG
jgi:(Z)-2-((N-methylformamido)methylene)-5-hydroxybutyrolactone dehydrogenase